MKKSPRRIKQAAWLSIATFFVVGMSATFAVSSRSVVCATCHPAQAESLVTTAHASLTCYSCHLSDGAWSWASHKGDELFRMYPSAAFGGEIDKAGTRISRRACTRCHANGPPDVIESKGLRIDHRACTGDPAQCAQCHSASAHPDAVRWARTPLMDDCVTCHAQKVASVECDTCHRGRIQAARLDSGPWQVTHGVNWESTHGMGNLATCTTCHEPAKCEGCHGLPLPHPTAFDSQHGAQALRGETVGELCTTCHRSEGWCEGCHGVEMPHPDGFLPAHSVDVTSTADPTCVRCHAEQDCVNCHVTHTHPGTTRGTLGTNLPSAREVGSR